MFKKRLKTGIMNCVLKISDFHHKLLSTLSYNRENEEGIENFKK